MVWEGRAARRPPIPIRFRKMKATRVAILFSIVFILAGGGYLYWRWLYPYGVRTCYLPCMTMALVIYADQHEGWFPHDGTTSVESLKQLYPDAGDPVLLAGISGDRAAVRARIAANQPLDEFVSSWVYFPGLRVDDHAAALIWERKEGLTFNGHRAEPGSHAVGFVDGHSEQIPAGQWQSFLEEQARLRTGALDRRRTKEMTVESGKEE